MPNAETTAVIQQARARNRLLLTEVEPRPCLAPLALP
jgi:hypothetical protein